MERLTEKDQYSQDYKIQAKNLNSHCVAKDIKGYVTYYGQHIDKLGEYEDLEEQGLLLRLPCRVGSTLYQPIYQSINEYKVIGLCFDIHHNKWMYEVAYETGFEWHKTVCDFNYIGKSVFLTKEEAEQKLKEMESD